MRVVFVVHAGLSFLPVCIQHVDYLCLRPVLAEYTGMSPGEIVEQIATTNLSDVCRSVSYVRDHPFSS